jgi:hypothetical protein
LRYIPEYFKRPVPHLDICNVREGALADLADEFGEELEELALDVLELGTNS